MRDRALDILLTSAVCGVMLFLILPNIVIVPISFTELEYISFPPQGFSLRWYEAFFADPAWRGAVLNSFIVAVFASLFATVLGTLAALGLTRSRGRWTKPTATLFLLPMIVPSIITAVAMYGVFARLGLNSTLPGLIVAHTVLALPFVIVNVAAVAQKMDWRIEQAARSLGADPVRAFLKVTLPAIRPGILAGAVFAFLTSFDEVVVALFVSGVGAITLPVQMWSGLRFEISPIVAAASCLLVLVSCLALSLFALQRRNQPT